MTGLYGRARRNVLARKRRQSGRHPVLHCVSQAAGVRMSVQSILHAKKRAQVWRRKRLARRLAHSQAGRQCGLNVSNFKGPAAFVAVFVAGLSGYFRLRHAAVRGRGSAACVTLRLPRASGYGRQEGVWTQRLRIAPDDPTLWNFGTSVSASGGIAAVGTPSGSNNSFAGVVYAYDLGCASLPCPGDFNADGQRGLLDFAILQRNFGQPASGHEEGDADGNGRIDLGDLAILANGLGVPCL